MSNLNDTISASGVPLSVQFWSYLVLDILSILCSLLVLYCLLGDRTLRTALHNHIVILILMIGLVYELTDIPFILHFNYYSAPMFSGRAFYLIWVFIDYAFYSTQVALFAWATIERHILIFHEQWVSTKRKRFFIHYAPIGAILLYCQVYYILVYFGPFCTNSFDRFVAGGVFVPCVFDKTALGTWDLLVHQMIPTLLIIAFSIGLGARILWQKRKLNQRMGWRKSRKMTIQLLSISALYLVFNAPWTALVFAFQYGLPADIAIPAMSYAVYFYYYVVFLFPFVCCGSVPKLHEKFKRIFSRCTGARQVFPVLTITARKPVHRTLTKTQVVS